MYMYMYIYIYLHTQVELLVIRVQCPVIVHQICVTQAQTPALPPREVYIHIYLYIYTYISFDNDGTRRVPIGFLLVI